jgi:uncharacterized membrane protein
MSTVIDHAISIPAPQEQVWQQVRDIQLNTEWQASSEQVTFLTGKQNGRGTRWRNTTPDGSEQVIEITAWYEGLGYEYVIVDGVSFETNRGRIRLQEVPEGTVVQWTFSYDIGGMFGGLRNALITKGRIDGEIVDSLRNLYRYVKSTRSDEYTPEQSRALMRAAPDVEERSKYQPRHPSVVRQEAADSSAELDTDPDAMFKPPADAQPAAAAPEQEAEPVVADVSQTDDTLAEEPIPDEAVPIVEPPLSDDDTRPNPTVQETDSLDEADVPDEATVASTPPDDLTAFDTQERPVTEPEPVSDTDTASDAAAKDTESEIEDTGTPESEEAADEKEAEEAPAMSVSESDDTISHRDDAARDTADSAATTEPEPDVKEVAPPQPPQPRPDLNKLDTSQVSVFDLFGVPKPSEADSTESSGSDNDMPAATDSTPAEPAIAADPAAEQEHISEAAAARDEASPFDDAPIVPDVEPEPQPGRTGLRAKLRRRLTRLRRP